MVEYGLILVLIAVVAIIGLTVLGHTTDNLYSNVANLLGT
jgi:Flp pilus assembly pilin Flp